MNAPSLLSLPTPHRAAPELRLPRVLLLGVAPRPPAGEWPCVFASEPHEPFDALMVVDAAGAGQAEALLRRQRSWLIPVADLSGSRLWFADVGYHASGNVATGDAIEGMLAILARLQTLPAPVIESEEPEAILLARAYSRGGVLQPVYDGSTTRLVRLPAAGLLEEPTVLADRLSEDRWFDRRFFDRLHVCPDCGSSRLNVREECSACRSADLYDETLVHHFRCAHQAVERRFRQGDALVCPKCRRTLRHFGVDYDRPGSVSICRTCGHTDADAAVGFVCADCGNRCAGDAITTRDWHSYTLTELAERRLLAGDLRRLSGGIPSETHIFHALAQHWMQIQSRYGRPATVLRVAFTRAAELQRTVGSRAVMDARRQAVEIVRSELRETDFMIEAAEGMLIVMPETDGTMVEIPRQRLLSRLGAALALDLGPEIRTLQPGELMSDDGTPR